MRHVSKQESGAGARGGTIVLLVMAGLLTAVGFVQLYSAWVGLPVPRLERLDPTAMLQAFRTARGSWTGDVRSGALLSIMSAHVNTALREPDRLSEVIEDARSGYAQVRGTQLGRLQLAALQMIRMQHDNLPLTDWWPSLEPFFTGLDTATFNHFLPELISANAAVYLQLGLAEGSALRSGVNTIRYPHGPFLQYFTASIGRLARARQEAGDATGAATSQHIARRLLRQWVLAPGPAALRLLAADLLARDLEHETAASAPYVPADVARGLRGWRAAYRDVAARRPVPLPLLSSAYTPEADLAAYQRLQDALAFDVWLAPALAAAVLGSLIGMVPWLRHPAGAKWSAALIYGLLAALIVVLAGLAYLYGNMGSIQDDLRRLGAPDLGWPRYPGIAVGLAAILLALTAVWPARGTSRPARLGAVASTMALALGATLLIAAVWTKAATSSQESHLAAVLGGDEFAAMAGPAADRYLDALRAWNP